MSVHASSESDSSLLRSWCMEQSQAAFAEIVRRYERLVIGAALRRASDVELARDVTQQVFTMLAEKAVLLVGRPSIAGWLYRASGYLAARSLRSDARRAARHEAVLLSEESGTPDDQWLRLEEALARLKESEREAVLLHYFQDLSYAEMSVKLGIAETAARKRVSRALEKLGGFLGKNVVPQSVLVGAAAVQAAQTASATLVAGAVAGTATFSTPVALLFHALMSHLPVKIAVCVATLSLLPFAYEWNVNVNLHAEVQERSSRAPAPSPEPTGPGVLANAGEQPDSELARLEAAARAAEKRAAELAQFKDRRQDELIVAMGTVESMAKGLGTTLRRMRELNDFDQGTVPNSPQWKGKEAAMKELQSGLPKIFEVMRELPRLERDPAKAARFYATMLAETAELDRPIQDEMERALFAWVQKLQQDSLALPQRPKEPAELVSQWDARRIAAMQAIGAQLETLVPSEKTKLVSLLRTLFIEDDPVAAKTSFDIMTGRKK